MRRNDLFLALLVIIVWGLNFIAIKVGLQHTPPLLLGAARFVLACLPAVLFLPKPPLSWRWLIALSLSINVGQFALLFLSMKVGMPAGMASLLLQSQAFFTLFIAVTWCGERWYRHNIIGLTVALGGMTVIGLRLGGTITPAGFILILAAAACWGLGNVIMRQATLKAPPFSMLSLVVWSGLIAILPLAALSWWLEGWASWVSAWQEATLSTWLSLAYIAVFATLVGYGLWGKLLLRYPAATVSPLALLVPLVGISSSALFLQETLSLQQTTGALLVMLGLTIHVFGKKLASAAGTE